MTTTVCYPPGTDWGCAYTSEQLAEMWADPVTAARMERSEALAWMQLAALTADQVGVCPITVRPCAAGWQPYRTWYASTVRGDGGLAPYIGSDGQWTNACGHSAGDCSCSRISEVRLPGPVGAILGVWVDGVIVDSAAYRVDDGMHLVRTDGDDWPVCQDMSQGPREVGAFSVTYYHGAAPDPISLWMAGLLAVEYYKACTADKSCRLPARLQSVARQGVTYQVAFEEDGTTGVREIDDYVRRLNPYRLKTPPTISVPRSRAARTHTWMP
jgi:hypothetical protein